MKYSENLIKKTMTAIENHPEHTFWSIHKRGQCNDLEFCEIRFENLDNVQMSINFCGTEVNAIVYTDENCNGFHWMGSLNLLKATNDIFMMWLGTKLSRMNQYAEMLVDEYNFDLLHESRNGE